MKWLSLTNEIAQDKVAIVADNSIDLLQEKRKGCAKLRRRKASGERRRARTGQGAQARVEEREPSGH